MSSFNYQKQDTILLHGGQEADPNTGSRAVPIHQTTSFVFKNTEHAKNLFGLAEPGNIYSRIMNPTVDAFEQRVAELEDGVAAVALSSGMAAITFAILNVASAGDEIIADSNLYGGTYNLFVHTLPRYGITVKLVDGTDLEAIENAITDKTKAVFGETITNPSLNVFDIEAVAKVAHKHNIPLIIDNTFAPYFSKPLAWGADIVVHSATKWIGGHGTTIGGVVVDGGKFNWDQERFPGFTEPDASYGGICYKDLGAPAFALKLRVQLLRDVGASLSPHSAFLLLQGLETLHVRIKQHSKNTEVVAKFLEDHPAVNWVNYPGSKNHPTYELANKYFNNSYGSIITFGIKGGLEAGSKLIDNIELWSHVANVGDAKSLIIHPASTTHQQLDEEGLEKSGVTEDLVRLSIGLESTDDILATLDDAISIATGEEKQITTTDEAAISWLLSSPFDRSEGIRQKVIAVTNLDNANKDTVELLQATGYAVVALDSETEVVDTLWANDSQLTEDEIKQLSTKSGKIVWAEQTLANDLTEQANNAGLTVITEKELAKELNNYRGK